MTRDTPQRQERIGSRLGSRLGIALLVGPVIGVVIGLAIGFVFFEPMGRGFTMTIVGTTIAATMLSLLWAGYSSLESPDPGNEPSDTERPLADRTDAVREERDTHGLPPPHAG
jgi:hypothetical protein